MSLVLGAAGPVGKRVISALVSRGNNVVAAIRSTPLPDHLQTTVAEQYLNVDVLDIDRLHKIFKRHPEIKTVWCMSLAPFSHAEAQVNGMRNVLQTMKEANVGKMIFMDSVASFGATAPRRDCSARWLSENPGQDPGHEVGVVKREWRRMARQFSAETNGDTRFAVVPGVLHTEASWGPGVTQYPLAALKAAMERAPFDCPVDPDRRLPMIFADDLVRGLMDLSDAPKNMLSEPEGGYCLPGFSFSASELFAEIQRTIPEFAPVVKLDERWDRLAHLWPETLSGHEAARDLGYRPQFGLGMTVHHILRAHKARRRPAAVMAELTSVSEQRGES
mmetsp:Transcript_30789/g.71936  ORF Transcript_30789/g.71936 Transcript_30789/m.71936 type:complete len:333 (+) Transcript_30789:107-1105(+)